MGNDGLHKLLRKQLGRPRGVSAPDPLSQIARGRSEAQCWRLDRLASLSENFKSSPNLGAKGRVLINRFGRRPLAMSAIPRFADSTGTSPEVREGPNSEVTWLGRLASMSYSVISACPLFLSQMRSKAKGVLRIDWKANPEFLRSGQSFFV